MNYIFVNLKRFDIPKELGGINTNKNLRDWGSEIISGIDNGIKKYINTEFAVFLPEAHIINALNARSSDSIIRIGSQSLHFSDVESGRNFGAFTSSRTAKSMLSLGCSWTMIGHCEERRDLQHIIDLTGNKDKNIVSGILNEKVRMAKVAGLKILFCVGETADEQPEKFKVIQKQIEVGLNQQPIDDIVIAYEPVWAIGPGKTPPDSFYINKMASFIKGIVDVPVVYGGGLKEDNAEMLANISAIDGGLIALTRFSGDIGFYPDEYLEIVKIYNEKKLKE